MDPVLLLVALIFGFAAQQMRLPPLVGFLVAGFALNALDKSGTELLAAAADVGVLLLLFTIGLKLRLRTLTEPAIWAGTSVHMALTIVLIASLFIPLGFVAFPNQGGPEWRAAAVVGFALSFSSTVFGIKILEEKGEMRSRYGMFTIGILIIQDLIAVLFLMLTSSEPPSPWALGLLALPLARPLFNLMIERSGHGEILLLFGLSVAIGGSALFDLVGMKADLGALVFGIILGQHPKSAELSRSLLGFKDFFLIGFFLSIGLIGFPGLDHLVIVIVCIALLLPAKMFLFFLLLTRFRLRARTSFLTMISLATFSEFGLIVAAEAAEVGWLPDDWLVVLALTVAVGFVLASFLNTQAHQLYGRMEVFLCKFQSDERLTEDTSADTGDAEVLVVGMGRVGQGAYDAMTKTYGNKVFGIDVDRKKVAALQAQGYHVIPGDAEDIEFWRYINNPHLRLVMLALPENRPMLQAVRLLKEVQCDVRIGAVSRYDEERIALKKAGVHATYNYYTEVGAGFADHVHRELN